MHLFSNRSQRMSKCGKNISDTLGCAACATFLFLPHFDVICDLLLDRRTATWNLFVNKILGFCYQYQVTPFCNNNTAINPLTPKISFAILLTFFPIILIMLVWRIWYWIN